MLGLKTIPLNAEIPQYIRPINRSMILLKGGRLMVNLHVKGMPFESQSPSVLNAAFEANKSFFNQLAKKHGGNLAIWTHIIKKEDALYGKYNFKDKFPKDFSNKYLETFKGNTFYSTDYYVSFVFKPKGNIKEGETDFFEIIQGALANFRKYDARILEVSDTGSNCENVEFLYSLLNGTKKNQPLSSSRVSDAICDSNWHFGYDLLEIRNNEGKGSNYASFFELNAMPLGTSRGMWDFVLKENSEFILTQSVILMKASKALKVLDTQSNYIQSGDNAIHELEEIATVRDHVATGEICFSNYHCSLAVFGKTPEIALQNGIDLNSEFSARSNHFFRSNLKSNSSFLSILPAATQRAMSSPRTLTNLACTLSFHNYSQGKKSGNPIGDGEALIPLKTLSNTIFYLNLHASELNKNVVNQKYAGHTMLLGASGAGKTTLEGVIASFLTRFNPQIFAIDYNRSTELYMRAFGAEYFAIQDGVDIGINLFQLNTTPDLIPFLNRLVRKISANADGHVNASEEKEIKDAINTVMRMDVKFRSLSMVLQSIQNPDLRIRLGRWCNSQNGEFAWCLDSPVNKFDPSKMDRVGFDSTLLLETDSNGKTHPASEPVLSALFFLKKLMQKEGRLLLTIVEEFWMPANFDLTKEEMKKILKAGRLKNEFMILSSQSPEDAINCSIFAAIIQQTATKIYLPNPDAELDSYLKCNVTKSEFEQIKKMDKTSRTFLIKQSNTSCFAKLDLFGFDDFLPILSGTDEDLILCEKIREKVGDNPDDWIHLLVEHKKNKLNIEDLTHV